MTLILGLLLASFFITSAVIIPFINTLYKLKFQRLSQATTKDAFGKLTPVFNLFHKHKGGTPVGGGLLVIIVVSLLFSFIFPLIRFFGITVTANHPLNDEVQIIFFTFISFGLLGLYDDTKKLFGVKKNGFFGLRMRHKIIIQTILGVVIALMLYFNLGLDILNLPVIGVIKLGWWYIPFAAFCIVAFANAVNITDGLDGLAGGVLMITLFALWFLSAAILDTPLSVFIALWLGALISFLYFNVFPARIFMGDVGALSFGATIAVIGLLLGKIIAVAIVGGIFVMEIISSLLQLTSKKFRGKKIIPVAPLHLWMQQIGWEEPKIVMRFWLAGIMLALFGLWLATT
jgi:phospho-N-acetylmuramoyl-pentapeptide-transferase